jgi:hypothetical protein
MRIIWVLRCVESESGDVFDSFVCEYVRTIWCFRIPSAIALLPLLRFRLLHRPKGGSLIQPKHVVLTTTDLYNKLSCVDCILLLLFFKIFILRFRAVAILSGEMQFPRTVMDDIFRNNLSLSCIFQNENCSCLENIPKEFKSKR